MTNSKDTSKETVNLRSFLRGIVGNAPFGIFTTNIYQEIGVINTKALRLLGCEESMLSDVCDKHYGCIFTLLPEIKTQLDELFSTHKDFMVDFLRQHVGHSIVNIRVKSIISGTLFVIEDVTEQSHLTEKLIYDNTHDLLTGLYNRQYINEAGERAIEKARKYNIQGAIIFIDLDRFKPINDAEGHAAGDKLLSKIAYLLTHNTRKTDPIARIGGDEFVILLEDCDISKTVVIAEKIRAAVEGFVFSYNKHQYQISLSMGICSFGNDTDMWFEVLNTADNACQIAKRNGRNRFHLAQIDNFEYIKHKAEVAWLPKIRDAIKHSRFVLYTQPIVPVNSQLNEKPVLECLLRMKDENDTIIPPAIFIPPAERYEMMADIDYWVIEQAFMNALEGHIYTINLSGLTVKDNRFSSNVLDRVERYNINPSQFIFEITETVAINNLLESSKQIETLKAAGFRFALDDFGSGVASFSYLKQMPFDILKIDGSFVTGAAQCKKTLGILKAIAEVGHLLELEIIAEYVESEQHWNMLKELGIEYGQGYWLGKPKPMVDTEDTTPSKEAAS
ncbi:diguanylate cyclase/phosphodiesterase (GGDEF & EAL domains) with PAS/PAC sensor(s) [Pseudoalteromonas luteoviolacea B = ATCC 29581]|nr:diguanylate cyclase/phosphodiesterase (GGDEF & EAL domains) with PAS/PAC sensor(s) [Pseudoalteromonas luteoviolacea B = ATCC 29581]